MINGGKLSKRNPEGETSSKNIKRPKRGEANLPDGHDESSLENGRKIVIEEIKKKKTKNNVILVSQMMDQTFPGDSDTGT